jgi:hypothetical protein
MISPSTLIKVALSRQLIISRGLLVLAHKKFISPEFIEVLGSRLIKNRGSRVSELTRFLDLYKTHMTTDNYVNFMEKVGKRKWLKPYHIFIVASGLKYCEDGKSKLTLAQLDKLFYNMRFMTARIGGVRSMVDISAEKLQQNPEKLSNHQIGSYVCALRNMRSGHLEVRFMISVLATKVGQSDVVVTPEDASLAISGLRCCSPKYEEVRQLCAALATCIGRMPESSVFTTEQLCTLLPGFTRMSPDCTEVGNLMRVALQHSVPLTLPSDSRPNALQTTEALLSLNSLTIGPNDSEIVRSLICLLTSIVKATTEPLDPLVFEAAQKVLGTFTPTQEGKELIDAMLNSLPQEK